MKRKSMIRNVFLVAAIVLAVGITGPQTGLAVEEHHQNGGTEKAPAADESMGSEMMQGSGPGKGSGMMSMMGQNMMGQDMMRMMMSHMMGGQKGGMGKMMQQMMGRMMDQDMMGMMGQMGPKMAGPDGGQGKMTAMTRMLDDLDLSSAQWKQVHSLAAEKLTQIVDLRAQRLKLQIELAGLKLDQTVDSQQVKNLFSQMAEAKAGIFLASIDYLRGLRDVLTKEQLKKLETHGL